MFKKRSDRDSRESSPDRVFDLLYPEGFPEEARTGVPAPSAAPKREAGPAVPDPPSAYLAPAPRGAWRLAAPALFVIGAALVILTQRGIGYAWDEAYYYEPAKKAAHWAAELATGSWDMLKPEAIDECWAERSEHPSFHKLLAGASLLLLEERWDPILAMRLPSALLFGGTLSLLYLLGSRIWSAPAGLAAAVAYAAMPRIFGHAHFSSMETPLNFSMMLTLYCYVRGLRSPVWAAACGAAYGLLLATKINAFFVFPPLLLWGHLFARRQSINNLFAMLTLGPLCFVLFWPWLWHDTPVRILDYLQFHATHQQTALYFMGRKWGYGGENAPWFYPSVMLGVTLPVGVLLLSGLGLVLIVLQALRRRLPLLVLLLALTMWVLASAPSTPRYDGVRLFLPLFPCLALFAGGGVAGLLDLTRWAAKRRGNARQEVTVMACVLVFALAAEGAWGSSRAHPYLLSYFNPLVGGLSGAAEKGFEVTYWGDAVNEEVLTTLNRMIPDGERLKVLALHELCFLQLQQWGKLKSTLAVSAAPPYYAHLVLHRAGFYGRPERALVESGRVPVLVRWSHDGVPLLSLYRTGPAFETFWPRWEPPAPAAQISSIAKP